MSYVLDTNTFIARLNGNAYIASRLRGLETNDVILCAPVLAELQYGACYSARRSSNLERLHRLAQGLRRYGELKASLRRQGVTKSDFDLSIAALALDLGAILVSDDHAFFDGSIPGLQAENWLAEDLSP